VTSTPITSVYLPREQNCRETGQFITAVVVAQTAGFEVMVVADAVFKSATGNQTWRDHIAVTVVGSKGNDDNSAFSSKNLPSTLGSILAVAVLGMCLIGGVLYWRSRHRQPTASFGRFSDEEHDTNTQSKFTISDNVDAQGYLTGKSVSGNTDQLLPSKGDSADIELSSKVVSALTVEPTPSSADSQPK